MFVGLVLLLVFGRRSRRYLFPCCSIFLEATESMCLYCIFSPNLPTHEIYVSHFFTVSMPCV